jgi:hypothetical protein
MNIIREVSSTVGQLIVLGMFVAMVLVWSGYLGGGL